MALARIITRSHACSRQLAIDLLSRGYAVEIVSPDAVPDNLADLELRVEEDPGNQLVASVETHNGERSASLEFLHYLKAPMPDFMRRPPELQEVLPLVDEPSGADDLLMLGQESAPSELFQITIPVVAPLRETAVDFGKEACLVSIPLVQPQVEVATHIATQEAIVVPVETMSTETVGAETAITGMTTTETTNASATNADARIVKTLPEMESAQPPRQSPRLDRSSGWLWRTALTSCALIVLALLLDFGMRRSGQASERNLGATVLEQAASVPTDSAVSSASSGKDSTQLVASAISPTPLPEASTSQAVKAIPVTKSARRVEKPEVKVTHHRENDIVARDTVTYLDRRFQPRASNEPSKESQTSKHVARRHRSSRHQGEVVAANKVTYLNKAAPKTAK
jgi:hypothetical protein